MIIPPGKQKCMAWLLVLCMGWMVQASSAVEIQAEVELQGAVEEAFERDVHFAATNAEGAVLNTWTETLSFTGGIGEVTVVEASGDLAYLSAKTDWTLRRRVACVMNELGQAEATFTGEHKLIGGDLNGDNQVDMKDFTILRHHWYSENGDADITGNGKTGMSDYSVLKSNWGTTGDGK